MRAALSGIAIGLFLTVAGTQAGEVFKWVDKDGSVHYGEFAPNNKRSTTIETPSQPEPSATESSGDGEGDAAPSEPASTSSNASSGAARDKFLDDRQKKKEEKDKAEKQKAEKSRACNTAKSNISSLESGARIRVLDENGNNKYLNPDEIKKQLAEEKKNVAKYCK